MSTPSQPQSGLQADDKTVLRTGKAADVNVIPNTSPSTVVECVPECENVARIGKRAVRIRTTLAVNPIMGSQPAGSYQLTIPDLWPAP